MRIITIILITYFSISSHALAYIGPGLGVGAIAVAIGFLISIVILIFSLIYFPIKIIIKKFKNRKKVEKKN